MSDFTNSEFNPVPVDEVFSWTIAGEIEAIEFENNLSWASERLSGPKTEIQALGLLFKDVKDPLLALSIISDFIFNKERFNKDQVALTEEGVDFLYAKSAEYLSPTFAQAKQTHLSIGSSIGSLVWGTEIGAIRQIGEELRQAQSKYSLLVHNDSGEALVMQQVTTIYEKQKTAQFEKINWATLHNLFRSSPEETKVRENSLSYAERVRIGRCCDTFGADVVLQRCVAHNFFREAKYLIRGVVSDVAKGALDHETGAQILTDTILQSGSEIRHIFHNKKTSHPSFNERDSDIKKRVILIQECLDGISWLREDYAENEGHHAATEFLKKLLKAYEENPSTLHTMRVIEDVAEVFRRSERWEPLFDRALRSLRRFRFEILSSDEILGTYPVQSPPTIAELLESIQTKPDLGRSQQRCYQHDMIAHCANFDDEVIEKNWNQELKQLVEEEKFDVYARSLLLGARKLSALEFSLTAETRDKVFFHILDEQQNGVVQGDFWKACSLILVHRSGKDELKIRECAGILSNIQLAIEDTSYFKSDKWIDPVIRSLKKAKPALDYFWKDSYLSKQLSEMQLQLDCLYPDCRNLKDALSAPEKPKTLRGYLGFWGRN